MSDREVFEVVVELPTVDIRQVRTKGFLRGDALQVRDMPLRGVPHMLGRVMIRRIRGKVDRGDPLQHLSRLVLRGQSFRVMEPSVVQHHRDLRLHGVSLQAFQRQLDLLGGLLALDRIDLHLLAGQTQRPEERTRCPFPIHEQLGALPPRQPHPTGLGLMLDPDLVDGVHLVPIGQQPGDLASDLFHPRRDLGLVASFVERVGQFETHPAQVQQQVVGRVGGVGHVEPDLHHIPQRGHVPELGRDPCTGGLRPQQGFHLILLAAGEFRGVLVTRVSGDHRTQPGRLPIHQPASYSFLGAVHQLRDDVHRHPAGGVKNSFCFHSYQNERVGAFLPPHQHGLLFRGDFNDLHL